MKKKQTVLMLIALFGLIVITAGVTYAFFSYAKEGTTDNTVTTGTITFLYTEVSGVGKGISIDDAYPISDTQGKAQTGEGKVFDFKITSNNSMDASIPYEVTARKKTLDNMLDEDAVKIYLTKVNADVEEEVLLSKYSDLDQTDKVLAGDHVEKTIYNGKVPANQTEKYEQNFRLRMWIDKDVKFSPIENEDGTITYPYNDKEFTITVNVYANAKVVTDEDIEAESKAEIETLTVGGTELTKVENQAYHYETNLPEGTTQTTIDVETQSPYADVVVERLDSLAYSSSVKRLSTKKTLELLPGDNYFKITVISENKEVENEYKLNIYVERGGVTLGSEILRLNPIVEAEPKLGNTSSAAGDADGLYMSTETNSGDPTYYFRGAVENNYVDFAGFTWRIVRINEDGTVRLMMSKGINNNKTYQYNSVVNSFSRMYYSNNSSAKTLLTDWYDSNIVEAGYSNHVVTGEYFCEQAKVKHTSFYTSGSASMQLYSSYDPDFRCAEDGNIKGIVNSNVGLITYDELVYAGGNYNKSNTKFYLYNGKNFWTMSPSGFYSGLAGVWEYRSYMIYYLDSGNWTGTFRPVINLKANTPVTGTGASDDHFIVQ